jgi:hypothetical protein
MAVSKRTTWEVIMQSPPPRPLSGATAPSGPGTPRRGIEITLRHTTLGRTPIDK